jgi:hypothetical protein
MLDSLSRDAVALVIAWIDGDDEALDTILRTYADLDQAEMEGLALLLYELVRLASAGLTGVVALRRSRGDLDGEIPSDVAEVLRDYLASEPWPG